MFDWRLFLTLVCISLPGIVVTTPGLIRSMIPVMEPKLPAGKTLPSAGVLMIAMGFEVLVLLAGFAALGTLGSARVGLRAPFFEAFIAGTSLWDSAAPQLLPMLIGGVLGGLAFVAAYYWVFRPQIDPQTIQSMESLRMQMGLTGRLLYGGVLEEVLTRWGLMSAIAWLGSKLSGTAGPGVMWTAIILSGIIFGLLHIPNYVVTGSRLTLPFGLLMLFLNLWASLVFGWLFWQYGLLAAIGAHMLFHLVWYPFDLHYAGQRQETASTAS